NLGDCTKPIRPINASKKTICGIKDRSRTNV
ncbi:MAG: hypothetical protein ACI92W_001279, partial [Paraglaciecola sp.]